jgi:UDP-perosamine 4-acetyltransferase
LGETVNRGVVIVGAGGHAKVCIELLRATGTPIECCIAGQDSGADCIGVPVFKGDEHLLRMRESGCNLAFIALGSNALRQRLGHTVLQMGYQLVNAISPQAAISPTARLGKGIAVMAGAVINASTSIGDMVIINTLASVDHDGNIGEAVHIAPHCGLAGVVTVAERAFLGIGCKVIPEISIGADAVVGAGSVVISDVLPHTKVAGVPARPFTKSRAL